MPYPAAEVSGMKDPKPPTLLRLRPIIAKARHQEAPNLEGLETVIPGGAPGSPLAFAKISMPASCHRKSTWEDPQEAVLFLLVRASPALSSCQQGTAPKENPEETPSTDYRTCRPGLDWCPASVEHPE